MLGVYRHANEKNVGILQSQKESGLSYVQSYQEPSSKWNTVPGAIYSFLVFIMFLNIFSSLPPASSSLFSFSGVRGITKWIWDPVQHEWNSGLHGNRILGWQQTLVKMNASNSWAGLTGAGRSKRNLKIGMQRSELRSRVPKNAREFKKRAS